MMQDNLIDLIRDAKLVLIRGQQGAGKSTLANRIAPLGGYTVLEQDDFFHVGAHYYWDADQMPSAYNWTLWRTQKALERGHRVVVPETFHRLRLMQPYLDLTPDHLVLRATGNYQNVHGVSPETVAHVRDTMETHHGEIFV